MENKEIMLIAYLFYRPEDAKPKRSGKNVEPIGEWELFYSFRKDEVSTKSIRHMCIVQVVTTQNRIPLH
ncbi:putative BAH domain-containing protein [Helianthus anomalus]